MKKGGELGKMVGASGNFLRKPLARLGELGGNLIPIFSINRPRGNVPKVL